MALVAQKMLAPSATPAISWEMRDNDLCILAHMKRKLDANEAELRREKDAGPT
jgi:hypothetical protein